MIQFSDSTSLYFYSALLQADAAIISIVGLFIIFWIQSIEARISAIMTFLEVSGKDHQRNIQNFAISSFIEKEKLLGRMNKQMDAYKHYEKWCSLAQKLSLVKQRFKVQVYILSFAIILNAALLVSSSNLHLYWVKTEFWISVFVLLLHVLILSYVSKIIIGVVRE